MIPLQSSVPSKKYSSPFVSPEIKELLFPTAAILAHPFLKVKRKF
jgi:hypothetical protein